MHPKAFSGSASMTGVASLLLISLVTGVSAFYGLGDHVIELDPTNFHPLVINSEHMWIVEFYAPWCGHCQALAPEWKKVATALKGIVKVGAVNADQHQGLGNQYKLEGYPIIKFFGENKYKPVDYAISNQRTASGIVEFCMSQIRSIANSRLSRKHTAGGKTTGGGGGGGGGSSGGSRKTGNPADVVQVTDSNFDREVLRHNGLVLLEFFAPWCGHCKALAPHWAQAATELKGKVKVCAVDATVHKGLAARYGVQGYPAIKWFPMGEKLGDAEDYTGGRTSTDIVQWALDKLSENRPPPEVFEVTSAKVFKENCENHQLCIISVLPQIYDCQSQCRNNYIKTLQRLGDKFRKYQWGWLWSEAGAQPALEETLEVGGFGYPALAALNTRKMKFSPLRGQFSEKGIHEFLRDLSFGKGRTLSVRGSSLPKIETRQPWDGKDAELPQEEDIDLSDVELEDLDKTEL